MLIDARTKLQIDFGKSSDPGKMHNAVNLLSRADTKNSITCDYFGGFVNSILQIWQDSGIQETYQRRNLFQLVRTFSLVEKT